eukprot:UN07894
MLKHLSYYINYKHNKRVVLNANDPILQETQDEEDGLHLYQFNADDYIEFNQDNGINNIITFYLTYYLLQQHIQCYINATYASLQRTVPGIVPIGAQQHHSQHSQSPSQQTTTTTTTKKGQCCTWWS